MAANTGFQRNLNMLEQATFNAGVEFALKTLKDDYPGFQIDPLMLTPHDLEQGLVAFKTLMNTQALEHLVKNG